MNLTSEESPTQTVPRPRRWHAPAIFWWSIAIHALALGALVVDPGLWGWVLVALLGNHVVLGLCGLWPRSQVLGENIVRLPATPANRRRIALTFDDGPDPVVTPQVLEILDQHGATASFFCVGERARACPEMVREIVRRGHSIENHSLRHPHSFACFGPRRLRREVDAAQRLLSEIAGQAPLFFRAPAGLRNPFLDQVMAQTGLHYISWTRRGFDAVRGEPSGVLDRLIRGLAAGDVLLLHDGFPAKTPSGEPVVLAVLPALLRHLESQGLKSVSLRRAWNDPGADAIKEADPSLTPAQAQEAG